MSEHARDERAERRERRKNAERERMKKHGAGTGETYRNAIIKRLRRNAGVGTGKKRGAGGGKPEG
jgi:hypothetical protein